MTTKNRLIEVFEYVNKISLKESLNNKLTYDEFVKQFEEYWKMVSKYHPNEVGFQTFTEKMAVLGDEYPEYLEKYEDELDKKYYN